MRLKGKRDSKKRKRYKKKEMLKEKEGSLKKTKKNSIGKHRRKS